MDNQQIVIKIHIDKESEKQFFRLFFNVPDNVESMNIKYTYLGDNLSTLPKEYEKNIIDFALLDENGIMAGATGSNKKDITISESYSTPGYNKIAINKGQWTIIYGVYLTYSVGVDVTYTITFTFKHTRWMKGDLHIHSVYSDGNLTINELGLKAVKSGLDFFISTDHNNFFHNKRLPDIENLTIIPGVEFTHYNGHMNFMGIETPYLRSYAVNSFEEFKALNKEAHDRGALISINHPLCSICPWKWGFSDFYYDIVEIWNGPMRKDNLRAIEWWHNELVKGRKLPAVGGSDFHKDFPIINLFATPTTVVYADSPSKNDILCAIRGGRVVITHSPKSSMIEMTSGNAVIGDSVILQDNTIININVSKLNRKHTLIVYDKTGIIHQYKAKKSAPYSISLPIKNNGFVRAEIKYYPKLFARLGYRMVLFFMLRKQTFDKIPDFILTLTNPIYFD